MFFVSITNKLVDYLECAFFHIAFSSISLEYITNFTYLLQFLLRIGQLR